MNLELVERIRSVQLTPVRIREGYNISEVDDFLAALAAAPPQGDPTTAGRSTSYGQSFPVAATPVIEKNPGLMARLFRRIG